MGHICVSSFLFLADLFQKILCSEPTWRGARPGQPGGLGLAPGLRPGLQLSASVGPGSPAAGTGPRGVRQGCVSSDAMVFELGTTSKVIGGHESPPK